MDSLFINNQSVNKRISDLTFSTYSTPIGSVTGQDIIGGLTNTTPFNGNRGTTIGGISGLALNKASAARTALSSSLNKGLFAGPPGILQNPSLESYGLHGFTSPMWWCSCPSPSLPLPCRSPISRNTLAFLNPSLSGNT